MLAEWCVGSDDRLRLHVYCHVSGEERWLAPPALRKYIFQREMPLVCAPTLPGLCHLQAPCSCWHCAHCSVHCVSLCGQVVRQPCQWMLTTSEYAIRMFQVLDTILHADRLLFQQLRSLADAAVVVHLSSHLTVSPRRLMSLSRTTADTAYCMTLHMY